MNFEEFKKELYISSNFIHIRDTKEHSSLLINIKHIETVRIRESGQISIMTARGELYEMPWSKFYEKLLISSLDAMKDCVEIHTDGVDPLMVLKVSHNGEYYEEE